MLPLKQSVLWSSLTILALLPLGSCANTPWAAQLEQALSADPRLQASTVEASPEPTASPAGVQLPTNFPAEIPRYPNAELVAVGGASSSEDVVVGANQSTETRWQTSDAAAQVRQFYQEKFQAEGWQIAADTAESSDQPIAATRDGLKVQIATVASGGPSASTPDNSSGNTEFTIEYQFGEATVGSVPSPSEAETTADGELPQPGDPDFIGPVLPGEVASEPSASPAPSNGSFSDLSQAPAELQPYITDLAKLGAFSKNGASGEFKPNAEISRREYARWLVTANNLIYANQPARKIRLAAATDQPAFQDMPASDPDFAVIQGLANAGVIPSPLTGDTSNTTFRPDAPLTREDMILWKVPVDTRQALPNAAIDTVQQAWGFQDSAKIDPKAMRAVLADHQNGDLSNIRRAFGYTTLFQPKKTVSRAEAAAVLWQFGTQGSHLSAKDALQANQPAAQPSTESATQSAQ
ncbi:MAG: S-layer homology domain-containing protein [Leptolyngbya sp. IPPAS B-1204]|nr:S-layer homology domain-containing protein [Elainella sp. C42_A2020_010]RNJ71025.1 MAG: S-layer homology domain-containing protein [Leptolyngbya sp. IPPAS B-1204]